LPLCNFGTMKRPLICWLAGVLVVTGCASRVQVRQLADFSAVQVANETVTFVSATNRMLAMHDSSGAIVPMKTLKKGESLRLSEHHGTVDYEVLKVAPEEVVLKEKATFYRSGNEERQPTQFISVRPYEPPPASVAAKIRFRLDDIHAAGLRGPPGGLVALAYEFCVPANAAVYAEVRRIDPGVEITPGGRGRIACTDGQALCIGQTHQPNWRGVLAALAALPYVAEIRQCDYE